MILLLGPSGSGKSTLVKVLWNLQDSNKLKSPSKNEVSELEELPYLIPTIGTNITNLSVGKRSTIEVRELGGSMAPIWKSYYSDAKGIIFIIDASNVHQIASASIELRNVVNSPDTQTAPVLVVFNKTDIPTKTSLNEMRYLSQVDNIAQKSTQTISVLEISCKEKTGIDDILKWLAVKRVSNT